MAAPVVKNFTQAVISGTGTATSPSDTSIGDLVIVFVWSQGTNAATLTHTIQSTFTTVRSHSHDDGTTDGRLSVACKVATAAGAQTYTPYTIANATAAQTCAGILVVTGANTNAPNAWIQASITDGTANPPNPPALTGLNDDVLVLAIGAWHVTTAAATSPTVMANYTLTNRVNGPTGSHVTHLAVATRALTGLSNATEDPVAFTDNVTPNGSVAMTIAIPITATYYVTTAGNDANSGTGTSAATAWKTLTPVNSHVYLPGDIVLFNGGETFTGGIFVQLVAATSANPVTFNSYGTGRATISSAVGSVGLYIYRMAGVSVQNLNFTGPGVATANKEGILFYNDMAATTYDYIRINNCTVTGYKQGIAIGGGNGTSGYSDVRIENTTSSANSWNGIQMYGAANYCHTNVYIGNCTLSNNPGVTGAGTPSGSGIELGRINGGTIELCLASGNGATQNAATGPFGIWLYSCNNVIIQKSESYNNASAGGDGGGFDLDGGCTNCIIQYCYSHGNKGAGFALFQYAGATTFSDNIIRYNISESDQGGGIVMWGSTASDKITNSSAYNNTIYASVFPACKVINSNLTAITIKNNIFLSTGGVALVDHAGTTGITFANNNYYNLSGAFVIWWGGSSYASRVAWGQDATGLSANPLLTSPGSGGTVGNAANLPAMTAYKISSGSSTMINAGTAITGPGSFDFYGNALYSGGVDIGSHEYFVILITKDLSDGITISEMRTGAAGFARAYADSVSMSETIAKITSFARSLSEPLTISEAIQRIVGGALTQYVSDGISVGDTRAGAAGFVRSTTDALTLAEAISRIMALARSYSDAIALSDGVLKSVSLQRSLADALTVLDNTIKQLSKNTGDAILLGDTITRQLVLVRQMADSMTLSEAIGRVAAYSRNHADVLSPSDAVSLIAAFSRISVDTISLGDAVQKTSQFARLIQNALTLVDVVTPMQISGYQKVVSDAVALGESLQKLFIMVRSMSDALGLGDNITKVSAFIRSRSDALTLAELVTVAFALRRSVADPLILTDAALRTFGRPSADALTLGETLQRVMAYMRQTSNALTLSDVISLAAAFQRQPSDGMILADVVSKLLFAAGGISLSLSDSIALSELLNIAIEHLTVVGDLFTLGGRHHQHTVDEVREQQELVNVLVIICAQLFTEE